MHASAPGSGASEATDRDADDFRAGSGDWGLYLSATSTGVELILTPTVAAEFSNGEMPPDWFVEPWKEGGTSALVNGHIELDGASAGFHGLYGSGRSLEFQAKFEKRPHQHIGFGTDFKSVPWITFSTKFGHSLYARSNFLIPEETKLSAALLGKTHRFRINWNLLDVDYWVDGRRVAYQLVPMVGYMRPLASNGTLGGPPVSLDWVRMTPYAPEGRFVSRVHDAGSPVTWEACEPDAEVPTGAVLEVGVRAGDEPEPGPRWSAWVDSPIEWDGRPRTLTGRYAQYRLRLATTDVSHTPIVRSVTLRYSSSSSSSS